MSNAQFRVDFQVVTPGPQFDGRGTMFRKTLYVASPDLKNAKLAKMRAKATAKMRLDKWLKKNYDHMYKEFQVHTDAVVCVG